MNGYSAERISTNYFQSLTVFMYPETLFKFNKLAFLFSCLVISYTHMIYEEALQKCLLNVCENVLHIQLF